MFTEDVRSFMRPENPDCSALSSASFAGFNLFLNSLDRTKELNIDFDLVSGVGIPSAFRTE